MGAACSTDCRGSSACRTPLTGVRQAELHLRQAGTKPHCLTCRHSKSAGYQHDVGSMVPGQQLVNLHRQHGSLLRSCRTGCWLQKGTLTSGNLRS